MPTFLCLGPILRYLGGPKGALKAPKISQNSGISDSVPSKPKWVEHWLNLVDHCISHSGGQFGSFGPIRNVNGRPQNGLKSALLAQMVLFGQRSSEQSDPNWVEKCLNMVEYCQTHPGGSLGNPRTAQK